LTVTSAPTDTEREPQAALDASANDAPRRDRTPVEHARADQIAVLDHGHVIETGTHTELVATGGRYAQLAAADELSPASPILIAA
jgi:ATP-binding cassette subfamily B protein